MPDCKKKGSPPRSKPLQTKCILAHRHFRQQSHPSSPLSLSLTVKVAFQADKVKQIFKKECNLAKTLWQDLAQQTNLNANWAGIIRYRRGQSRFWMYPHFPAVRYETRDLQIDFSRSGDVAWFYCLPDDINERKGQPASWENTRWSGVLERRRGRWVIVQMHFSFASES